MDLTQSAPKSGEGTGLWLLKIATGALVIILLGIHLTVNHLTAPQGLLDYHEVAVYLSHPGIALMEGSFLVIVVTHALLGLRSIILDLKPSRRVLGAVNWGFSIVGAGCVVYGIWLLQVIVSRGAGG